MKTRESAIRNQRLLHLCIIIVSVLVAYNRVFGAGFLNWDDGEYVLHNNDIRAINTENIKAWFSSFYIGNYHPLTMASYATDHALGGMQPFIYHLSSILLHMANACLVYAFIGRLQRQKTIALAVALLFALHPSQTESVSWIAERKTVLCGFFYLLAMLQYQAWVRQPKGSQKLLLILLSACAMFSKGTAVALPVSLLAIDLWLERDLTNRRIWIEKLPLFILAAIMGSIAIIAQQSGKFMDSSGAHSFIDSIVYGGFAYIEYIVRFFAPVGLSAMYPYPDSITLLPVAFFTAALGMIVLFVTSIRKRWHVLGGGILFFTANIILLLQLIPFGEALMADRYMYIACIGLAYPTVYYVAAEVRKRQLNRMSTYAGIIVAASLLAACFFRNDVWLSDMKFYNALLERFPDSGVTQYSVGAMYLRAGDYANAELHLDKAVRLEPNNAKAWYNKGLLHMRQNQAMNALDAFDRSISINDYPKAHFSRAMLHLSTGKPDLALADIDGVLKTQPRNARALCIKGDCMERMGRLQEALENYNLAIAYDAVEPLFYVRRGATFFKKKQFNNAISDLDMAIELSPGSGEAFYWRAMAKHKTGQGPCTDLQNALSCHYMGAQQAIDELCK